MYFKEAQLRYLIKNRISMQNVGKHLGNNVNAGYFRNDEMIPASLNQSYDAMIINRKNLNGEDYRKDEERFLSELKSLEDYTVCSEMFREDLDFEILLSLQQRIPLEQIGNFIRFVLRYNPNLALVSDVVTLSEVKKYLKNEADEDLDEEWGQYLNYQKGKNKKITKSMPGADNMYKISRNYNRHK